MPWLRGGTVAVTNGSTTVTGTNADFAANSRVGDAFIGPDGFSYEIGNVASATVLSILPAYKGPTVSGASYAIMPVNGYSKMLVDAFNNLNNQFGGVLAVLGQTPTLAGVRQNLSLANTDGLSEGATNLYYSPTRLNALPGLSYADKNAVMATDSIVAAFGKLQGQASAALPLAGGTLTGAINDSPTPTFPSAATVNLAVSTSNVIAVSGSSAIQSLGSLPAGSRRTVRFTGAVILVHNASALILPTSTNIVTAANDTAEFLSLGGGAWLCVRYNPISGKSVAFAYDKSNVVGSVLDGAILESGSSASGSWIKFLDGTMECANRFSTGFAITLSFGSTFYASGPALSFPQPFIAPPILSLQCSITGGGGWLGRGLSPTTTTTGPYIILSPISRPGETVTIEYIAKGRWKA